MSLPRGAGALGVGVASSHHERPVHELVLFWESDLDRGLSEKEAESRLDRFGPNALPRNARHGPLKRLLGQFHNPLIYVLLAAMLVTLAVGHVVDALVIAGVVLVNAFIGFMQEWRAGEALEALAAATRTHATVLRRGILRRIDSLDVVPGDLVLIEAEIRCRPTFGSRAPMSCVSTSLP